MDLLDNLLEPYKITLGLCFNAQSLFVLDHKQNNNDQVLSFALSPLYSFKHVDALHRLSQGKDCTGLGLELSH